MNLHPSMAVVASFAILSISGIALGQQPVAITAAQTAPPGLVRQIKVLPDQAPDCTSLKTIAETVTPWLMSLSRRFQARSSNAGMSCPTAWG